MAHLHFKRTVYKSGGGKASGRVSYITRQPVNEVGRAEQQLRYISHGLDLSQAREDCLFTQSRNLPVWADGDPHTYFREAEAREPANWTAFEEWKVSLPAELNRRQQMALTRDLVQAIAGNTLPITYALHDPRTADGTAQQPHLHLLISARQKDDHARTVEQHFRRYNRKRPELGGCEKSPAMHHMGSVKANRVLVSDILNAHLQHGGYAARVHPDSLQAREIDRTPERKLRPSDSAKLRRGEITERMQEVLESRAQRTEQRPVEQANACEYWQHRKTTLHITPDMPMDQQLAHIKVDRRQAITRAPERRSGHELEHEVETLTRTVTGLEGYVHEVQRTVRQEQRLEQTHGPYEWRQMRDAERVLADGVQHGLPRDQEAEKLVAQLTRYLASEEQEPQAGASLNVRLFREAERDRGMGW